MTLANEQRRQNTYPYLFTDPDILLFQMTDNVNYQLKMMNDAGKRAMIVGKE